MSPHRAGGSRAVLECPREAAYSGKAGAGLGSALRLCVPGPMGAVGTSPEPGAVQQAGEGAWEEPCLMSAGSPPGAAGGGEAAL